MGRRKGIEESEQLNVCLEENVTTNFALHYIFNDFSG